MKKKIKDLTLEEVGKYCNQRTCKDCPFADIEGCILDDMGGGDLMVLYPEVMETEVEIDEQSNINSN